MTLRITWPECSLTTLCPSLPRTPRRNSLRRCETLGDTAPRDQVLAVFRRHLARVQQSVRERFEDGLPGLQAGRLLGRLMDGVIQELHGYALRVVTTPGDEAMPVEAAALVATGGYGRGVLAPFSDIDLLFVSAEPPGERARAVVEFVLYFLWDLGLKVGHATRSIEECIAEARGDVTVRTSLIDARLLSGDADVFTLFRDRFLLDCQETGAGAFIAAKQVERDLRHRRFGESPFLVEPNIKEGKGGCATCKRSTGCRATCSARR